MTTRFDRVGRNATERGTFEPSDTPGKLFDVAKPAGATQRAELESRERLRSTVARFQEPEGAPRS